MEERQVFKIRNFKDEETKIFLRGVLGTENCIPFIGTGFTGGEKTRGGRIPFGGEWMQIMKDQISLASTSEKPTVAELETYSFQKLSDIYFRKNIVNLEQIKETINSRFTQTIISNDAKLAFLRVDWPYIYTLNIDDGIERAIDGVKVLPYNSFSPHGTRRFVYKLHGDAEDAISAHDKSGINIIFGTADYIKSLINNKYLIGNLTNDFSEKNILFVGCSLTDEIDISYSLAGIEPSKLNNKNAIIYVTSSEPSDYTTKSKLEDYGITDVIVCDYSMFYSFVADVEKNKNQSSLLLDSFEFKIANSLINNERLMRYIVQDGWRTQDDPYECSIPRECEANISALLNDPIVVVWGRRFSGKTTLLYRVLRENLTRKRFHITTATSVSDTLVNNILSKRDALIAIDTDAMQYQQIKLLVKHADRIKENNTTIIFAVSKNELNGFPNSYIEGAIEIATHFRLTERMQIDKRLSPMGFQRWVAGSSILDNIFSLSNSEILRSIINGKSRLYDRVGLTCDQSNSEEKIKLEFSILFYIAVKQRMYSFVHRSIIKANGLNFLADDHLDEFARKWAPFAERDESDSITRRQENSSSLLLCNSYAWIQYAIRKLSARIGKEKSATYIVDTYSCLRDIDNDPFQLLLFDSLNSIYEENSINTSDWRNAIIKIVYEKLAPILAQSPDYWLQRAKSIYHSSRDESELRRAIEYCSKGIAEKESNYLRNAKFTKANLLGKLCVITKFLLDDDIRDAILAYSEAIADPGANGNYISELLKKGKNGVGDISKVCRAASTRAALLPYKHQISFIEGVTSGSHKK
jgi:hypothetical protein